MTEGIFDLFTGEQIGKSEITTQDVIDLCMAAIEEVNLYIKYTNQD